MGYYIQVIAVQEYYSGGQPDEPEYTENIKEAKVFNSLAEAQEKIDRLNEFNDMPFSIWEAVFKERI